MFPFDAYSARAAAWQNAMTTSMGLATQLNSAWMPAAAGMRPSATGWSAGNPWLPPVSNFWGPALAAWSAIGTGFGQRQNPGLGFWSTGFGLPGLTPGHGAMPSWPWLMAPATPASQGSALLAWPGASAGNGHAPFGIWSLFMPGAGAPPAQTARPDTPFDPFGLSQAMRSWMAMMPGQPPARPAIPTPTLLPAWGQAGWPWSVWR